jgi:ricin-type beta-trefoil lectin protein
MMKHWFGVVLALLLSVIPTAPALAQYQVQPPYSGHSLLGSAVSPRLCLQPEYEARINGLAIVQQPCNRDDLYQRWSFLLHPMTGTLDGRNYRQAGIYHVVNSGSGQCLDDRDGKTADRSPVQQWPCNFTSTTMAWKLVTVGKICAVIPERCPADLPRYQVSTAQFINMRSKKCLDVRGGSDAPGTALQIYHCTTTGTFDEGRANKAQVFGWSDTRSWDLPGL